MPCPLCRQLIDNATIITHPSSTTSIPDEQLRAFSDRRPEYLADLRGPKHHTKNAAFLGNNAFARGVAAAIGDELELRRKETMGGERCMCPRKNVTTTVTDDQLLNVQYKVGRKVRNDVYAFCDWPTLQDELRGLFTPDHPPTMLALATYGPAYFWLIHHHSQGKVETAINDLFPPTPHKRQRIQPPV